MSRYGVMAFIQEVNMEPEALAAYRADPAAYTRVWDRAPLTGDERRALGERDYAALYAAGAHPYVLWSFTEAVLTPEVPRGELVAAFAAAASVVGYPDPSTTPSPEARS